MGYLNEWDDSVAEHVRKSLSKMFSDLNDDIPETQSYSVRLANSHLLTEAIDRCLNAAGWSRRSLLQLVEDLCSEHPITQHEGEMQGKVERQFIGTLELVNAQAAFFAAVAEEKRVGAPRRSLLDCIEQTFELPKQEADEVIEQRRIFEEANKVANEARDKAYADYMAKYA